MSLVLNHSKARGTDKVVLLGIANHDGDGGAWPSLATLARYANVDERSVRRSIANLVALGELAVEYNGGGTGTTRSDRRPNLYRILYNFGTHTSHDAPPMSHGGTRVSGRDDANGGTPTSERGDVHVTHGGTPTSPEPSLEPSINHQPPIVPLPILVEEMDYSRRAAPDAFEAFWSAYPRKAGKRAARSAWERAVNRAGADAVLSGALRYAADPNREDAYTAHASTWLNRDGWEDEPLPARSGPAKRPSATAMYLEAADTFTWSPNAPALEA